MTKELIFLKNTELQYRVIEKALKKHFKLSNNIIKNYGISREKDKTRMGPDKMGK